VGRIASVRNEPPFIRSRRTGLFNDALYQGRLTIDYLQRLFYSRYGDPEAIIFTQLNRPVDQTDDLETIPYHLYPQLGLHRRTGEFPVAIHLAGEGAILSDHPWWGKFWWTSSHRRFRRIVRARADKGELLMVHNDTKIAYRDLCPDSILGTFSRMGRKRVLTLDERQILPRRRRIGQVYEVAVHDCLLVRLSTTYRRQHYETRLPNDRSTHVHMNDSQSGQRL
jgi:hypothetical protein